MKNLNVPDKNFNHVDLELTFPKLPDVTTESGRVYTTPEGGKYMSITTLLSKPRKEGLEQWKKRVGPKEAERVRKKASNRGNQLHFITEQYLLNNADYMNNSHNGSKFLFNAFKKHINNIDNVVVNEEALYSDYLKLAGRVDLIADYKNKKSIIDFKTSKYLKKKEWIESYFLQGTFYSLAFEEMFEIIIPNIVIIFAHEDGTSAVFEEKRNNWVRPLLEVNKQYNEQFGAIN